MTIELNVNISADLMLEALMRYFGFYWCKVEDIVKYLDAESVIEIGTNYSLADAIRMENDVVYQVVSYLSNVYEIDTVNGNIPELRAVVAQLTASEIGFARLGASIGSSLTSWASRLQDSAWRTLMRYYVNQNLPLSKKDMSLAQRLITSKIRGSNPQVRVL